MVGRGALDPVVEVQILLSQPLDFRLTWRPRRLAWPRTRPFQGRDRGFESRRGHHRLEGHRAAENPAGAALGGELAGAARGPAACRSRGRPGARAGCRALPCLPGRGARGSRRAWLPRAARAAAGAIAARSLTRSTAASSAATAARDGRRRRCNSSTRGARSPPSMIACVRRPRWAWTVASSRRRASPRGGGSRSRPGPSSAMALSIVRAITAGWSSSASRASRSAWSVATMGSGRPLPQTLGALPLEGRAAVEVARARPWLRLRRRRLPPQTPQPRSRSGELRLDAARGPAPQAGRVRARAYWARAPARRAWTSCQSSSETIRSAGASMRISSPAARRCWRFGPRRPASACGCHDHAAVELAVEDLAHDEGAQPRGRPARRAGAPARRRRSARGRSSSPAPAAHRSKMRRTMAASGSCTRRSTRTRRPSLVADLDVVVPEDAAAGDVAGPRLAEHGVRGALARLVALHLVGEAGDAHHELVGRGVERALAVLEIEPHAHARGDELLERVGRLDLLAAEPILGPSSRAPGTAPAASARS